MQSNVTDNESVKMKTSHGVQQGYNGIAVVDSKHQVVVNAEAFSEGQDYNLLKPALEETKETFKVIGIGDDILQGTIVTADTGFHTTENLAYLEGEKIDGIFPIAISESVIRDSLQRRAIRKSRIFRHGEKSAMSALILFL